MCIRDSDKGLSRYDGKFFKQYASNTQQGRSLSNLNEANKTIWCQDFSGNFYFVSGDSVVNEKKLQPIGYYSTATFIKENLLVTIGNDNIQTLNVTTREFKKYSFEKEVGSAISYEKDNVIIINGKNQWVFDGTKITETGFLNHPVNNVFFMRKFGGEYYGISKNTYPVISVLKDNQFVPLPLLRQGLFVQDVTVLDDLLWISTSSGAWCFGLDMKPAFGGHCFFEGKSITKILKDREGSYWFGTLDNGVLFVPDMSNRLYTYLSLIHISEPTRPY